MKKTISKIYHSLEALWLKMPFKVRELIVRFWDSFLTGFIGSLMAMSVILPTEHWDWAAIYGVLAGIGRCILTSARQASIATVKDYVKK